ncbi:hypothetical protein PG985_009441 [Apiospora marii]|uniref:uncharacterized protein n=1 Tax=Apiospora marii TaxID=335849 RepID=UPI00312EE804
MIFEPIETSWLKKSSSPMELNSFSDHVCQASCSQLYTMDVFQLRGVLDHIHPSVADRRLRMMDTNNELLNALSFDTTSIEELRYVLQSIAMYDALVYDHKDLENAIKHSTDAIRTIIDFLKAETPILLEELLQTIYLGSTKEKIETLDKDSLISRDGVEIYDRLRRFYQSRNVRAEDILQSVTHRSIQDMAPYDKEIFYFHLSSGLTIPPLFSDIDRFANRCTIHVVPERAPRHHTGAADPDNKYATELGRAIRMLGAQDATTLLSAVDSVYAKLAIMPRHIMGNYRKALRAQDDGDIGTVDTAIFAGSTSGQEGLFMVINGVKDVCEGLREKPPRILLDLPIGDLIDINNALYQFLKDVLDTDEWGIPDHYPMGNRFEKGEPFA